MATQALFDSDMNIVNLSCTFLLGFLVLNANPALAQDALTEDGPPKIQKERIKKLLKSREYNSLIEATATKFHIEYCVSHGRDRTSYLPVEDYIEQQIKLLSKKLSDDDDRVVESVLVSSMATNEGARLFADKYEDLLNSGNVAELCDPATILASVRRTSPEE